MTGSTQPQPSKHPFLDAYIRFADGLSIASGRLMAVFVIVLILAILHEIVRRYFFGMPTIWGWEFQGAIFGAICMLSIPYATYKNLHPRVPIFLDKCSSRVRFYLEILYILIFLVPLMWVLFWFETQTVYGAWRIGEFSTEGGWEPLLWPILLPIPLGAALVLLQSFAELAKIIKLQDTL